MCLAVPGKIVSLKGADAEVDFNGVRRAVSLDLVPGARKGDYVLVHAGFAIQVLQPQEAEETLKVFAEVYGKEHADAVSGPLAHNKP